MGCDTRTFVLAPAAVLQGRGDEALLLNLNDETMFALNQTGARIVELLTRERSLDDVAVILASEFRADKGSIARDVSDLAETLAARG